MNAEEMVEDALFQWLATNAEVWDPSDVTLECVAAIVSFLEKADAEELKVWFEDVEISARPNPVALEGVSDAVVWEELLLEFVTLLGDDKRLLSFGESQVTTEPLDISFLAVAAALGLLVENPDDAVVVPLLGVVVFDAAGEKAEEAVLPPGSC